MKKCNNCNNYMNDELKKCPICGTDMIEEPSTVVSEEIPRNAETVVRVIEAPASEQTPVAAEASSAQQVPINEAVNQSVEVPITQPEAPVLDIKEENVASEINTTSEKKPSKLPTILGIIIILGLIGFGTYYYFTKIAGKDANNPNTNNAGENNNINDNNQSFDQTVVGEKVEKKTYDFMVAGQEGDGFLELMLAISNEYNGKLTKNDYNKCPEELERGITIDITHVTATSADKKVELSAPCTYLSGIKEIITTEYAKDGMILVVSASNGVKPQTTEYVRMAKETTVPKMIVFINTNNATESQTATTETNIKTLLNDYGYDQDKTPIIKGSIEKAISGDATNKAIIKLLIEKTVDNCKDLVADESKALVMAIEDVFTITGRGTVVTGRIKTGTVKTNDEIEIVGLRETQKSKITGIEMFRKTMDSAKAGDNVGLTLEGIERDAVERGQMIVTPGTVKSHKKFETLCYVLAKEEGGRHTAFNKSYRPQFYFQTTDVTGHVTLPDGVDEVHPGSYVRMTVELISGLGMKVGDRFSIREGGRSVGTGVVTKILD